MNWTVIIGLLAFSLSLFTFILTRYERRKRIIIEITNGYYSAITDKIKFIEDYENEAQEIVVFRLINSSIHSIVLDKGSVKLKLNDNYEFQNDLDLINIENMPHPFNSGSRFLIGLYYDAFLSILEDHIGKEIIRKGPLDRGTYISFEIKDMDNRTYKTKYKFLFEVYEFERYK